MENGPIVSSESELLILVDQEDNTVGFLDKAACHDGKGLLHRAFSVFILNSQGEILLQKRSLEKRLWGGFWSNSCCSHPRKGERVVDAAKRRCQEELGIKVDLKFLYKFSYEGGPDSRMPAQKTNSATCSLVIRDGTKYKQKRNTRVEMDITERPR